MANCTNCTFNFKNSLTSPISLTTTANNSPLTYGNWATSPPSQINAGATATFEAQGASGTMSGTQGDFAYIMPNGTALLTVNFDVPYSADNAGSAVWSGAGVSTYCGGETNSAYTSYASFPMTGNPDVYLIVAAVGSPLCPTNAATFTIATSLMNLAAAPGNTSVDIETCVRLGLPYTHDVFAALFGGQSEATILDILNASTIAAEDRVAFLSLAGLISDADAFSTAIDFTEHLLPRVNGNAAIHDLAGSTLSALRSVKAGADLGTLNTTLGTLRLDLEEAVDGVRGNNPDRATAAVLGAMQSLLSVAPSRVLLSVASAVRSAGGQDPAAIAAIADWQLGYAQKRFG